MYKNAASHRPGRVNIKSRYAPAAPLPYWDDKCKQQFTNEIVPEIN